MAFNQNFALRKLFFSFLIFLTCMGFYSAASAQYFTLDRYTGHDDDNTFPTSAFGNNSATIKNLHFSTGDTLWAGTYRDGLIKWWKDVGTFWSRVNTLDGNEVYNFIEYKNNTSFFTDYNSFTGSFNGLYKLNSYKNMNVPNLKLISKIGGDSSTTELPNIHDMIQVGDSLIVMATDSGLVYYDGQSKWGRRNPRNSINITEWKLEHVAATSTGQIYMSAQHNLYRSKGTTWEHIDLQKKPYKLKTSFVKDIITSPEDTMWVITNKELIKFTSDSFYITPYEKLKPLLNEVKSVAFDSLDNPWIIFELNGGVMFLDESQGKKQWEFINSTNSSLPDEISCIAADGYGRIWMGTDNDGLFNYRSYNPAGIATDNYKSVDVFPNPNNGSFSWSIEALDKANISVYNPQGQLVFTKSVGNSGTVETGLESGIYLVHITDEAHTYYTKMMVK